MIPRQRSAELFARAVEVIPGGVNSPVRAFKSVGGDPLFIARGEGPFLVDADGNRFLDLVGSWGPLIFGHADPDILDAVRSAMENGLTFGASTEGEVLFAEEIRQAVPSIEKVRLVSSGTEAAMSFLRAARGFTGRTRIIKFEGCYHGHSDALLAKAGSGIATLGLPDSAGVPASVTASTLTLPYNDLDAVATVFAAEGPDIAAVALEPVVGNMGCVPPAPGFLSGLREITARHGALLLFDEVMTGFRLAYGGAQERFGITPDLTALGKIVGGGLPLAAYGGRADIMDMIAPVGPVYQAGTLSGNPLAVAAGRAMLRKLRDNPPYAVLEDSGVRLAERFREAARQASIPVVVNQVGSMLTVFFTETPVTDYTSARTADTARYGRFFRGMLERGVYLPPSQFEAAFLNAALTEDHLETVADAARETFAELTRH
ncbi:MAG: glutamate-1-semialdehyde 2,1-aminomutase [Capsulimonadales bacterium]|nr:glutamate-1-semialdehyde 2,1-aminomutase [Capsulimonadales bacterium]